MLGKVMYTLHVALSTDSWNAQVEHFERNFLVNFCCLASDTLCYLCRQIAYRLGQILKVEDNYYCINIIIISNSIVNISKFCKKYIQWSFSLQVYVLITLCMDFLLLVLVVCTCM